jgi:superfamily II DNA or RNA helicase
MEQDLPPYRSSQEEMLSLLLSYPPGRIYGIAPKQVVLRGFDYYRNGSVLSFKWSAAPPALVARVRGAMIYSVTISADGHDLRFHCDCPAWTPHSNCKHAVGSMFTIKNLLEEGAFRTGIDSEDRRVTLLSQLYSEPDRRPAAAEQAHPVDYLPEEPEYSIIISRAGQDGPIKEIYVRKDGHRLKDLRSSYPHELGRFIPSFSSYMFSWGMRVFDQYLDKYGNKYPFVLETQGKEQSIAFDGDMKYKAATSLDASSGSVTVGKIFVHEGREAPPGAVLSGDYLFDAEGGRFSWVSNRGGWRLWEETASLLYAADYMEHAPEIDATSFSVPVEIFQAPQFIFPSSEGETPIDAILKKDGETTPVIKPDPSYRLTISRASGENDFFTLRAEYTAGGASASPVFKLFSFLTSADGTAALRTNKRREVLYRAFFGMLTAQAVGDAEKIIRKELSPQDFGRYGTRKRARDLLRRYLALFHQTERQLLIHDGQWISVAVDKAKELSLYRIPYEVFGRDIFKDMRSYDVMTVSNNQLSEGLPLLYDRLKEEGIALFFDHKPVKTGSWEFAFDATGPAELDWFEIRPEIRCDGHLVDERTWQRIMQGRGINEEDDCIRIMDANSRRVFRMVSDIYADGGKESDRRRKVVKVPRLQILDWLALRNSGVKVKLSPEDELIMSRLAAFEKLELRPLAAKLKAKLRRYQKEGFSWLSFLYENRFGACLADDMGLGKTIQAISLLAGIKEGLVNRPGGNEKEPHLIVLPPSLLFNWENEIKRFYPKLATVSYTGKERSTSFEGYDAVLTTYGLVRRDIEKLKEIQFDVIIFDEAQAVKNIFADVTGAVRKLKGRFKLAMTGTPLENHVGEYYSIIDLAVPGVMGEYEEFMPLIKREVSPAMDKIIRRSRPFVLRRTKEKILKELPPKTETDIYLDLTEKQKALYRKTVEQVRNTIDEAYSTKTRQQAQIIALTAILKLRQICVSPRLLSEDLREASPKIVFLIQSLKELLEEDHSALVFSQFTSFLDLLGEDLEKHDIGFLRLDGSTPVVKRKKLIETFQRAEGPSVFLLSLKAGGQGLNLTKASYVFHLDPWWNPAVENQASDRAHRIGQKKNVTITRILMRHTIEEKMMALKKRKLELYKAVIEDSGGGRKGFSVTKSDFNFLLG